MENFKKITEEFHIDEKDIRSYSPLTLAYLGDDVFDVVIRSLVVAEGNTSPNKLHQTTAGIVKAASQAAMAESLKDVFTDEEADIYRRGRNAKSKTMAKNATVMDYREATGLEAVMGYLYLLGREDRLLELVKLGLERCQLFDFKKNAVD